MKIKNLPNGHLKISISDELERRAISRMRDKQSSKCESRFIKRFLRVHGFKEIKPEDCGALTSAPLIQRGNEVYGFMDYAVCSFIEQLVKHKEIVWQAG